MKVAHGRWLLLNAVNQASVYSLQGTWGKGQSLIGEKPQPQLEAGSQRLKNLQRKGELEINSLSQGNWHWLGEENTLLRTERAAWFPSGLHPLPHHPVDSETQTGFSLSESCLAVLLSIWQKRSRSPLEALTFRIDLKEFPFINLQEMSSHNKAKKKERKSHTHKETWSHEPLSADAVESDTRAFTSLLPFALSKVLPTCGS